MRSSHRFGRVVTPRLHQRPRRLVPESVDVLGLDVGHFGERGVELVTRCACSASLELPLGHEGSEFLRDRGVDELVDRYALALGECSELAMNGLGEAQAEGAHEWVPVSWRSCRGVMTRSPSWATGAKSRRDPGLGNVSQLTHEGKREGGRRPSDR